MSGGEQESAHVQAAAEGGPGTRAWLAGRECSAAAGRGQGVHWSSKVVRVVLGAVEGRINTVQDCHIVKGKLRRNVTVQPFFYDLK